MDVLIIHYNTPELTSATIKSLWRVTPQAKVTIFDNSDKRPFPKEDFPQVKCLDNTSGQFVNWEKWLRKFPTKEPCPENNYGSAKHCYSVELCYDMFPNGFVLMDSDVLIRKDITPMCDKTKAFVGRIHCNTRHLGVSINRLCPWICWINTPMVKKYGIRYFNPDKMWKLHAERPKEYYDTGAWFLLRCLEENLPYEDIEILDYIIHFRAASWHKLDGHIEWLNKYRELWWKPDTKIYICTHKDFLGVVHSPVYEVIDARYLGNDTCANGMRGAFYSELYQYKFVLDRGDLPDYVGFCGYRKYFSFMDNVPIMKDIFKQYDAIAIEPMKFIDYAKQKTYTVREWYGMFHNIEDLNIVDDIIKEHYGDFYEDWSLSLNDIKMYAFNMFVVRRKDFEEMMTILFDILDKYLEVVGVDIEKRILDNKDKYHIGKLPYLTLQYQYRIGGFLGERITNALLQHRFKNIKTYKHHITQMAN